MEISVGAVLEGTIKSITKFGAFVTLPGGRSGLVHISEISHSYVANVSDVLSEGQAVKVKVVSIDEAGRINLSMKKAAPPPPRPQGAGRDRQNRPDFRGNSGGTGGRRGSHHPSPARGSPSARRSGRLRGPAQAVHAGLGQQTLRPENDGKTQLPAGRPPLNPPTFARILPTARRGPGPSRPPAGCFLRPLGCGGAGNGGHCPAWRRKPENPSIRNCKK